VYYWKGLHVYINTHYVRSVNSIAIFYKDLRTACNSTYQLTDRYDIYYILFITTHAVSFIYILSYVINFL